jgi:hypothetical protein
MQFAFYVTFQHQKIYYRIPLFPSVCYYDLFLVSFVCVFDQLRHSTFSESINLACCRATISYFLKKRWKSRQSGRGAVRTWRHGWNAEVHWFYNEMSIIHKFFEHYSQILRTLFTNSSKVVRLESQVLTNFLL